MKFFNKRRGFLICFTGIDGSGKTTHANSLINQLKKKGYQCKYVWAAGQPILSYIFFAITWLLGYWKKIKKDSYTDPLELAPLVIRDKLGLIWRFFIFLDFQIKTFIKIQLPLFFGSIVVSDRYVYDLIMELNLSKLYSARFGKLILQVTPSPNITFLMDVPEDVVNQRRDYTSLNDLSMRRKIYLKISKILGFKILDTSVDINLNMQKIYNETISKVENHYYIKDLSK